MCPEASSGSPVQCVHSFVELGRLVRPLQYSDLGMLGLRILCLHICLCHQLAICLRMVLGRKNVGFTIHNSAKYVYSGTIRGHHIFCRSQSINGWSRGRKTLYFNTLQYNRASQLKPNVSRALWGLQKRASVLSSQLNPFFIKELITVFTNMSQLVNLARACSRQHAHFHCIGRVCPLVISCGLSVNKLLVRLLINLFGTSSRNCCGIGLSV